MKPEKDDTEFQHPYFIRGQEHLLENIKRKVTSVSLYSTSCSGQTVENQRIKLKSVSVSKGWWTSVSLVCVLCRQLLWVSLPSHPGTSCGAALQISRLQALGTVPFVPGSLSPCFQPQVPSGTARDIPSPTAPTANSRCSALPNQTGSEFSKKGRCVFPGFLNK